MSLKDFWKRAVVKLCVYTLVVLGIAWLLGPNTPLPSPPEPSEVGMLWDDGLSHGSGSYHDPYLYRLRI